MEHQSAILPTAETQDDKRSARGALKCRAECLKWKFPNGFGARESVPDPSQLPAGASHTVSNSPDLSSKIAQAREKLDAHVRDIVEWHFNPETGSPFWLEKAKS